MSDTISPMRQRHFTLGIAAMTFAAAGAAVSLVPLLDVNGEQEVPHARAPRSEPVVGADASAGDLRHGDACSVEGSPAVFAACVKATLTAGVTPQRVEAALAQVRAGLRDVDGFSYDCHGTVHEVGRLAGRSLDPGVALAQDDQLCQGAYLHGVIEDYGETAELAEFENALPQLCASFTEAASAGAPGLPVYDCLHAVGHGIGNALDDDLDAALRLCLLVGRSDDYACASGTFMTYLDHYQAWTTAHDPGELRPPAVLDDTRMASLCETTALFADSCWAQAGQMWLAIVGTDFAAMFPRCEAAGEDADACVFGIGVAAIVDTNFARPDEALAVCTKQPRAGSCYKGIVDAYAGLSAATGAGSRSLCAQIPADFLASCELWETDGAAREATPEDVWAAP